MLEMIASVILKAAKTIADSYVKGEELSGDQIKILRTAYFLSHEWAQSVVDSTDTTIDNDALAELQSLIEDTATEGGFSLP